MLKRIEGRTSRPGELLLLPPASVAVADRVLVMAGTGSGSGAEEETGLEVDWMAGGMAPGCGMVDGFVGLSWLADTVGVGRKSGSARGWEAGPTEVNRFGGAAATEGAEDVA